jgi:putative LysE/RhtB family amino acid efflux pump
LHAFTLGFGLGFLVALQLGPISLYLIRSTLRGGLAVGLAIAAGVAIVDLLYAALGAVGAAPLLAIEGLSTILGLLGAAVLVVLGAKTLRDSQRIRLENGTTEVAGPKRSFLTALTATASNPLTIASWAAIFSAASAAGPADSVRGAVLLLAGVGLGSAAWDSILATVTALVRRIARPGFLRTVDLVAGIGLIVFGVALAYGTLEA